MARGIRALKIWFLSIWHHVSQKQLGLRAGFEDEKKVSYLLGRPHIKDEEYEKLLAATLSTPAEVEIVTACVDGLKNAEANEVLTEQELEEVERGVREGNRTLRHLLTGLAVGTRRVPPLDVYPRPEDLALARFHAARLWEVLETMTEAEQLAVVLLNEDHHSWALVELVCEASAGQASRNLERAASLARLAQEIAGRVQGPEGWQTALRGYAAAFAPNVSRMAGELEIARAGTEAAKQLWAAGSDPDHVLDPGRLLDLDASLCRDERQLEASQLAVRIEPDAFIGGEAIGIESEAGIACGAAVGIEPAAFIGFKAVGIEPDAGIGTPERRNEAPELVPESRLAGRRGEKRPGEDDRGERWTHRRVSCTAPAPGHHGPRGPRLPDILRQETAKNPNLLPVGGGMTWKNLAVRLIRALSGQTQERFSETTKVDLRLLDKVEQGRYQPGTEILERVTRRGYGLEAQEAQEVLRFAESLRRPRKRSGQTVQVLVDDLEFLVSRVYQRLLRLPLETAMPGPEDPRHIVSLWALLKDLPEAEQRAVVKAGTKFQNWALAIRAGEESVIQASRDIERAASLAQLAEWIADLVPGPETWRNCVRGLAAGYGPNVLRVAGDLEPARTGMELASRRWATGSDPAGLLDPGRLLEFDASLCRAERRFDAALARLAEAEAVGRAQGRILVNKGTILEAMGNYEGAVEALREAERHIDRAADPRLWYMQQGNLAVNYSLTSKFQEASELVRQVRPVAEELGDQLDLLRLTALEGRIAAGQGRSAAAVRLLTEARQAFAGRAMWYDVALMDLEMAPLLLAEGATARVRQMAAELVAVFEEKGIHREALAALKIFHEAAEREKATAELARRVLEFLFRARWDEGLRFGE